MPQTEEPVPRVAEQHVRGDEETDDRQERDDVVAVVQRRHRVLLARRSFREEGHRGQADDRREDAEGAQDEREHDPLDVPGHRVDRDTEDHGADVLGGHGLEEVGATAGAVADVVTDEVGDDGGVARVVFRDTGLDLTDEVRADVGSLGVDTTTELGEERDEAGAEAEADDEERRDRRRVAEDLGCKRGRGPRRRSGSARRRGSRKRRRRGARP